MFFECVGEYGQRLRVARIRLTLALTKVILYSSYNHPIPNHLFP